MNRLIATLLLSLSLAAPALAQADFERHALSVDMVQKYNAASLELKKSIKSKDDGGDKDGMTVDQFAKELDAVPGVKPILAKHGMSARNFALTMFAVSQASVHLAMEPSADKKTAAQVLASYTPETRANIELLRKNPQLLK
jgi:hypothetical protein